MDDAARRERETEVMALLEQLVHAAEEAQSFIQDDSRISGRGDITAILERVMHIRAITLEIEHLIRPPRS